MKNWKQKLANYLQKTDKEIKIKDKKVLILNLLKDNLTTEESIDLFSNISEIFNEQMRLRLKDVEDEKAVLNNFFCGKM